MKAVQFTNRGEAKIVDRETPVPGHDQILVRTRACGLCQYDMKCFTGAIDDEVYRTRPGHEGVGIVEEVGNAIEDIAPGDKVTSIHFGGAMAEYFTADRGSVEKIPPDVSEYEFWISEPVACVVNALRQLQIEPGERVVLIGCGYMGLLILQGLPKSYIQRLAVIDVDSGRLRRAERFGAEAALDGREPGTVKAVREALGGAASLVIEAAGKPGTIETASELLQQGGRLCIFGHHPGNEDLPTGTWHMKGIHVFNTTPYSSKNFHADLQAAVRLMERGVFDQKELINKTYAFSQVQEALEAFSSHPPAIVKTSLVLE
jgi:threonine dehydrogenase-like Zn-dependent dehydrogenase